MKVFAQLNVFWGKTAVEALYIETYNHIWITQPQDHLFQKNAPYESFPGSFMFGSL